MYFYVLFKRKNKEDKFFIEGVSYYVELFYVLLLFTIILKPITSLTWERSNAVLSRSFYTGQNYWFKNKNISFGIFQGFGEFF